MTIDPAQFAVAAVLAAFVLAAWALLHRRRRTRRYPEVSADLAARRALSRAARFLAETRRARDLGFREARVRFEFSDVMGRVRRAGAEAGPRPAGASFKAPKIPGLDAVPYLTMENVWNLETLPARLLVLGGGPGGVELAQAFARLGSAVTLVEAGGSILPGEEPEVASSVAGRLSLERVTVLTGHRVSRVAPGKASCENGAAIEFDQVILAPQPRSSGITLEDDGTVTFT